MGASGTLTNVYQADFCFCRFAGRRAGFAATGFFAGAAFFGL
jgi:hypothetical protein